MIDAMELKALIVTAHAISQLSRAQQPVLIEGLQVVELDRVLRGIKVRQIAEQILECVADLAVIFRNLLHQIF